MMKFLLPRAVLVALTVSCVCAISASGQNSGNSQAASSTTAPAHSTGIGSAPANSHQSKVLAGALSPSTRQTLQAAMDSMADK